MAMRAGFKILDNKEVKICNNIAKAIPLPSL
jgi:hypothetical protein